MVGWAVEVEETCADEGGYDIAIAALRGGSPREVAVTEHLCRCAKSRELVQVTRALALFERLRRGESLACDTVLDDGRIERVCVRCDDPRVRAGWARVEQRIRDATQRAVREFYGYCPPAL